MGMKKHNLAIVGFGGMAGWHYDLIEKIENLSVSGIWDIKKGTPRVCTFSTDLCIQKF